MNKKELLTSFKSKHNKWRFEMSTLLIFFALLISAQNVTSQERTITGNVIDVGGLPLPGTSVFVKGTAVGTVTDFDGNYSIKVSSDKDVLVFTFIGYITAEQSIDGESEINVILKEDAESLDEVVVVGYGTQKRSDLTGSVASVDAEVIAVTPVASFDLALQGRAPGVQISSNSAEPGGATSIRIRGANSVLGNNEPLIVLDGYPLPQGGEADGQGGNSTGQSSNPLSFINPQEIESIDILKDASATAIYGSRGANGVIIITTKSGNANKAVISLIAETGVSTMPEFPQLLDGPTFATLRNENAIRDGNEPPYANPENLPTTNWLDHLLQDGINNNIQLSARGGTNETKYYLSTNYFKNEGILKYTKFERANIRLNFDTRFNDKFSLKTSVNYTTIENNRSSNGTGLINGGPVFAAYKADPTRPVDKPFDPAIDASETYQNPVTALRDKKDITANRNLNINLRGKYTILKGLNFNFTAGITNKDSRREIYYPVSTSQGRQVDGRAIYNTFNFQDALIETFFTYNKSFGKGNKAHKINLAGGYSFQENTQRKLNNRVEGFPTDALTTDAIGLGINSYNPVNSKIKRTLASYYFRANYNYKAKYFLTFTGRADGSSVFAENQKWGFFPSGAVGWTVSNEEFFQGISSVVSNLKFRASYGITGSQSIPPLRSLTILGPSNAVINDELKSGLAPTQLANPNLEWEKTRQLNVGMDLSFLNGRIYSSFDYYEKTTDDLLMNFPLPLSAGFNSMVANSGAIENKGFEAALGAFVIQSKNFTWNTNINYSHNRSKVLALGANDADIFGRAPANNIANESANIMRVGEVFGAQYGYRVTGLIQESDFDTDGNPTIPLRNGYQQLGSYKFEDLDGDGIITANDREIIGDPTPDFIFGWNNDFTLGNFSLSAFIQGVVGNDVVNVDRLFIAAGRTNNNSLLSWYENRWTPTNPTNDPRLPGANAQANQQVNSAIVEDGSYVRLKNVSLSYNVPTKNINGFNKIRLYLTGTNLVTYTNYTGFDPEVNTLAGSGNIGKGIDFASYPRAQTYTLGVELGF